MSSASLETSLLWLPREARSWALGGGLLALGLVVLVVLYRETALSMAATWWRSETYAHGMVIPVITGYMAWTRRHHLARVTPSPEGRWLVLLGGLALVWTLANAADVLFAEQLAFTAMIPVLVLVLLGSTVGRMLAFPLAYLFFAVPLGEGLIPPLQDFTAHFSVAGLRLTGVPLFTEGRYITIPSGRFEVAEACSGVRYLIASLALGCLFAYLNYRSPWRRLAFIAAAAVIPVLANGMRAYGIILLAHLSDMRLAVGVDHIIYGWVFFGVVMALLFWVGSFWRESQGGSGAGPDGIGPRPLGTDSGLRPWQLGGLALTAVLIAAAGPALGGWLARGPAPSGSLALTLPSGTSGWRGPETASADWQTVYPGADARVHRVYRGPGTRVHALAIHYRRETQGKELVASRNRLYDGRQWARVGEGHHRLQVGDRTYPVRELRLRNGDRRRLVWSWFVVGDHRTVRPVAAKVWKAWNRLWRNSCGSTLVALAADYRLEAAQARRTLARFSEAHTALLAPGGVRIAQGRETP